MKVRIEESFPGEFSGYTPAGMQRRADVVIQKAVSDQFPRGGEVDVVSTEAHSMAALYEQRMQQLIHDFAQILLEDGVE